MQRDTTSITPLFALVPVLAAVALLTLGHGLQGTLLGLRGGQEGMSAGEIGFVMSAYFAGFAVGSVWSPHIIAGVGHIRAFAAFASVTSAIALAYGLHVSVPGWLGLRFLNGFCYAAMIVVVESWLNAATPSASRGRVLATYGALMMAAWAASQPLIGLADPAGFILFAVISILVSLSLVPLTLSRGAVSPDISSNRSSISRLFAISPVGLVGGFVVGIWTSAFWGLGPTFGQMSGVSNEEVATFMAVVMLGALMAQWPIGWLSDLIDRRVVIGLVTLVAALVALALAQIAPANRAAFLSLSALYGGASITIYSVCLAHINDRIEADEVVAAASALLLFYAVGSAIGPLAIGIVMETLGPAFFFTSASALQLGFAAYVAWRLLIDRRQPEAGKQAFVAMPANATSHMATELHRHGPAEDQKFLESTS
ncbi:MAG: MFS transporter [Pseudomonadota bacterium]